MLSNEKIFTTYLLNLLFATAKETGKKPQEILKQACDKCQINFPKNVSFKITSNRDFGKIKIGNELIFDSFQRELIDNKVYYFIYEDEKIHYEDFAKYNAKENSFKINDEINYILDENFCILGQLIQISGNL